MKVITTAVQWGGGFYLQELRVTEDELGYIRDFVKWLRGNRFGSIEFKRNDANVDVITTKRKRTQLTA